MKTAIQAELPEQLVAEARAFVEQGWVGNFDELLAEALPLYLESHSTLLAESFIQEDVAWGCVAENVPATSIIAGCR
ncbi:MAG TPA: CopG family transcriptional regulator [Candidatus Binatia bacterium]|jgi:hypothetical protein|nr:CopG family transcriptional regulator [Candidatus Binatia bacterium]